MTRARPKEKVPQPDALHTFRRLTKVDALLFAASRLLGELKLKEIERQVERARTKAVKRLEGCQSEAYRQMCSEPRRPRAC